MVSTRNEGPVQYAPVNESTRRGGQIKYLNEGAQFVIERRRQDAYRQMHNYCGGAYRILSESEKQGEAMTIPVGGMYFTGSEQWQHIKFECGAQ